MRNGIPLYTLLLFRTVYFSNKYMDTLLEQLKSARLEPSQHPSITNLSMRETRRHYRAFTNKTKFVQLREVSRSREKKKNREWRTINDYAVDEFGHTRESFSQLDKEHIDPSMNNWQKEHIHFLSHSYKHPESNATTKRRFQGHAQPNEQVKV